MEPSQPEIEPTSPNALGRGSRPSGHAALFWRNITQSQRCSGHSWTYGQTFGVSSYCPQGPGGQTDFVNPYNVFRT